MRSFSGHTRFVQSLTFSPDGQLLATGSADGTVILWNVSTGAVVHILGGLGPWIGAVAFSPDGASVVTGSLEGDICFWNTNSGTDCEDFTWKSQGRITGLAFSPNGERLVWVSYQRGVVCDLRGKPDLSMFQDGTLNAYAVAMAPSGKEFATGGMGNTVTIRTQTGQEIKPLLHGDRQGCWDLAYSPDGRTLALALGEGMQLWNVPTGTKIAELNDHARIVSGVAISRGGDRLLTCSWDATARLYAFDQASGKILRHIGTYDWGLGTLFGVTFSPDGSLAATCGERGDYVTAWDVE